MVTNQVHQTSTMIVFMILSANVLALVVPQRPEVADEAEAVEDVRERRPEGHEGTDWLPFSSPMSLVPITPLPTV